MQAAAARTVLFTPHQNMSPCKSNAAALASLSRPSHEKSRRHHLIKHTIDNIELNDALSVYVYVNLLVVVAEFCS